MTVLYGAPRRTNRRPREGGDVMNMVRDQAVMATDKAVFDNQTRPFRAPEKTGLQQRARQRGYRDAQAGKNGNQSDEIVPRSRVRAKKKSRPWAALCLGRIYSIQRTQ